MNASYPYPETADTVAGCLRKVVWTIVSISLLFVFLVGFVVGVLVGVMM